MHIFILVHLILSDASYTLSTDKKVITISGSRDSVTKSVVQDSKLHANYIEVIIKDGIISIDDYAFTGCISMTTIEIGSMVESVGQYAFDGCKSLKSIVFPSAVKTIGAYVLNDCSVLSSVVFPSSLESLGLNPFQNANNIENISIQFNLNFSVNSDNSLLIYNGNTLVTAATKKTAIVIPSNITTIKSYAFFRMSKIKNITFEEGSKLTDVQASAFSYCGVKNLTLPEGTLNLMKNMFYLSPVQHISFPSTLVFVDPTIVDRTSSLMSVSVAPGCAALSVDEYGVLYTANRKSILFMPDSIEQFVVSANTTSITTSLLQSKSSLVKLSVNGSNSLYCSYNNTLYQNNFMILEACIGGADHVSVHVNCTTLAASSFAYCNIQTINFEGSNLKTILGNAFSSAEKLKELVLPDSLVTLKHYVISGVTFTKIVLPPLVEEIGSSFIYLSKIEEIDLHLCNNLKTFSEKLLVDGNNLKTIKFPPNLERICSQSLMGLSSLKKVMLPKSLLEIESEAFKNCAIEQIDFEDFPKLETIGAFAFENTKLETFSLPDSVISINEFAFSGCSKLNTIIIGVQSNLSILNPGLFKGTSITNITFGKNLKIIKECALTGCNSLINVFVSSENLYLKSINGSLYSYDLNCFIVCPCGKKEVDLLESITRLEGSAFYECISLQRIDFGQNEYITEIGPSTFYGCSNLDSITLPIGLSKVETRCFSNCLNLKILTFLPGCNALSIGSEAFSRCLSLDNIDLRNCIKMTSLNQSAFQGCSSLRCVYLPSSLSFMGPQLFSDCTSLKEISFCQAKLQGAAPPFSDTSVFSGCPNTMSIYVPKTYLYDTFCGRNVLRILDTDCNMPTFQFTNSISGKLNMQLSISLIAPHGEE